MDEITQGDIMEKITAEPIPSNMTGCPVILAAYRGHLMWLASQESTILHDPDRVWIDEGNGPRLRSVATGELPKVEAERLEWDRLPNWVRINVWDLSGSDLRGADLSRARLRGANLRASWLSGADLSMADLREADMEEAILDGACLEDANLRSANLQFANLSGALMQDCDLRGANLQCADLSDALDGDMS